MLTGARKGEELDITSSSGYLFGAACKIGMKVIVMQSVAGETTIASVYTQVVNGLFIFLPCSTFLHCVLLAANRESRDVSDWSLLFSV